MMKTIKSWIEQVYKDNGIWPTIITGLVIVALLAGLAYLNIPYENLLP